MVCDPPGGMAKFLTQEQINEYKECFSLYDRRHQGKISASDLLTVMRCLGTHPTLTEVQRHLLAHKTAPTGELDFSSFLSIMHRQQQQEDPGEEILEAMRRCDQEEKGFILASELRTKLTSQGERLTQQEVDDLLKGEGVGADGHVYYDDFTKALIRPARP